MGDRKTAYIATVERIDDIEDKFAIKYIKLVDNGFQIIHNVVNTPIKVGDKIVYIEYDTIIQPSKEFEFLRKRCWNERKQAFHLRAMKMAGVISYGLILTCEQAHYVMFERGTVAKDGIVLEHREDGYDLSEALGIVPVDDAEDVETTQTAVPKKPMSKFQRFIKKYAYFIWKFFYYRKPASTAFPSFCANKTDETRIENLQYVFEMTKSMPIPVYVTEKIDGQSFTAAIYKNEFIIASRNLTKYRQPLKKAIKELVPSNEHKLGKSDDFIAVACHYNLAYYMNDFCKLKGLKNITMQAELAGPAIQKNKLGLKQKQLFIYNVYNPDLKRFYSWDHIAYFAYQCNITTVPLIDRRKWNWTSTKELKEFSKGEYDNGTPREGIVIRFDVPKGIIDTFVPLPERGMSNMWSLKVINPDFDAKYNC